MRERELSLTQMNRRCGLICANDVLGLRLEDNFAKETVGVVIGAGGEEKMVRKTVGRSGTAGFDAPELVDVQHAAIDVSHRADELAGNGIEGVNGALGKIVGDEQSVAERAEVIGRDREHPRLIQHAAAGESFQ